MVLFLKSGLVVGSHLAWLTCHSHPHMIRTSTYKCEMTLSYTFLISFFRSNDVSRFTSLFYSVTYLGSFLKLSPQ